MMENLTALFCDLDRKYFQLQRKKCGKM